MPGDLLRIFMGILWPILGLAILVAGAILLIRVVRAFEKIGDSLERIAIDYQDRGAS